MNPYLTIAILWMRSDGGDVASVHISVIGVVGADKDLDGARVLYIARIDINDAMCCSEHMASCYDGATAIWSRLFW